MAFDENLLNLLRCPRDGSELSLEGNALVSPKQTVYPLLNGVPWLLPTPQNSLHDWKAKLSFFNQVVFSEIESLEAALAHSQAYDEVRYQKLIDAKRAYMRRVSELLFPLVSAQGGSQVQTDPLRDRAPATQNLLSYEANFYRDWVWGDEENALSFKLLKPLLDQADLTRFIVLGAGAGRLAVDIHEHYKPELTVATDINPLLVLSAEHILSGQDLKFVEFPIQPKNIESVAVEHIVKGHKKTQGFHFVFSDSGRPPFVPKSFDSLLTSWFIDIQPLELSLFLRRLNQYLKVGGTWINFGSLVFNQSDMAKRYSLDEVIEIATECGFSIDSINEQEIPYLKSPYNTSYRVESVWSWRAEKVKDVLPSKISQEIPLWIRDTSQLVPKQKFVSDATYMHRTYAQIASDIDGKKSLSQIAKNYSKQNRMDEREAAALIGEFLLDLYSQNNAL